MNPRAAINDLLTFQASPFSHLGTSPSVEIMLVFMINGEGGIRTHAPLRTNGFQDRLVMTTSIPLHRYILLFFVPFSRRRLYIITNQDILVNSFFHFF